MSQLQTDSGSAATRALSDITYVQSQSSRAVHLLITVDTDQRIALLVQGAFQADDYELESLRRMLTDVVGNFGNVGVVKSCVDFVQYKKR